MQLKPDDTLETLGALIVSMVVAALMGYGFRLLTEPVHTQIVYKVREPSYDEVHVMAYDFMRDNPKVRLEMCSKRFVPVMDGGVKP